VNNNQLVEQQLTVLMRRVQHIHDSTATDATTVDRSAYGIMSRLADEGPQRLGALASVFGLDPSTITRQVQALEHEGFASRTSDPSDRRAVILELTDRGVEALNQSREFRRSRLQEILCDWDSEDCSEFARLLEKFNLSAEKNDAERRGAAMDRA
jgi:DNA-binding MarR family transcriptional regulator